MIHTLNPSIAGGNTLEEGAERAARHGFGGIELPVGQAHERAQKDGLEAVADIYRAQGVVTPVFGLSVEWRKDEEAFTSSLKELDGFARTAAALGANRCATWVLPNGGVPVQEYRANSVRRLAAAAKIFNNHGISLGLEFIGPRHFRTDPSNVWFYDIAGALQACDEIAAVAKADNLGLLVDCFHWFNIEGSTMDLAAIPVEQIVHVHINDAPNVALDEQRDNVRFLPGATGAIDITGFLKTLAAIGYEGPVSTEVLGTALDGLSPDEKAAQTIEAQKKVFATASL
ncbi:MAG TPA: sugar phosphate isomerase/epimerase family protein [Abditibacteriaceae bacterium]|jgi:sugar phosphate isomerase/epimerase